MQNEMNQFSETAESAIKINFKITEQDFMTQMDFIMEKVVSKLNMKSRIMLCASVLLVVLLLAVMDWRRYLPIILLLLLLAALLLALNKLFALILRITNSNAAKAQRESGAFDSPVEAVFYPDRLTITGAATHSVFQWDEMTNAYETTDGLHMVHHASRYFYIPARFFDDNSAAAVTALLQQTLGEKFSRDAQMMTPDTAENPGEGVQPLTDEAEPVFRYDFAMTGRDVTAVSGRRSRIMLTAAGAVIAAVCGIWAYGSIKNGNTYNAVFGILIGLAVIVVFVSTYVKNFAAANYPSKNISLRWYDDHVTAVVYQEDEGFNRVPYAKIKKISRQGSLTVVTFQDNTFLFVPQSSFSNEGERAELEEFLNKKQLKYSKLKY